MNDSAALRRALAPRQQEYTGWCSKRDEQALDYQRKLVPFLRGVVKLKEHKSKAGKVWLGIAPKL
jgi:hypothetical protein